MIPSAMHSSSRTCSRLRIFVLNVLLGAAMIFGFIAVSAAAYLVAEQGM